MNDLDKKIENNHVDFDELPGPEAEDAMGVSPSLSEETLGGNGTKSSDRNYTQPVADSAPTRSRLRSIRSLLANLPRQRTDSDTAPKAASIVTSTSETDDNATRIDSQLITHSSEGAQRSVGSEDKPKVTRGEENEWHFESHGIYINVVPTDRYEELMYGILPETLAGKMDFAPGGRKKFKQHTMSESLLYGIRGLQDFFTAIDEGNSTPEYLYGVTNKRMATAAKRLGFETAKGKTKRFSLADNKFDRLLKKDRIVGDTQVVRKKLEELLARKDGSGESSVVKMLENRISATPSTKP